MAKVELERSRALLYAAASAWDAGRVKGPQALFEAKVAADETAVFVTGEAMTIGGGTAYAGRLPFERYFRDARAGMVMGVAHDIAEDVRRMGGRLALDDLRHYRARLVAPLECDYRNARFALAPGLTAGPSMHRALKALAEVKLARGEPQSVAAGAFASAAAKFREAGQPLDAARCEALAIAH